MNRLKKYTLTGIVFVIITGTLSHFVYEWTGNSPIAAPFFPVNESTWEHMKLVFFPTLIYGIFMISALKEEAPCITAAVPSGILAGTAAIPVLFYTYTGILGFHIFILDIAVFLLSRTDLNPLGRAADWLMNELTFAARWGFELGRLFK